MLSATDLSPGLLGVSPSTAARTWLFSDYNQAESRVVAWKGPVPKLKQWYSEGRDVHAYVCQLIAKVIQEHGIQTPVNPNTGKQLFKSKHWSSCDATCKKPCPFHYGKGDEERELAKRVVHAYNYGMGPEKFATIAQISVQLATILLKIYGTLFPEIKTRYQAWIEACLKKDKTIWMPEPVKFRKIFHEINPYVPLDGETLRSAYSSYAQCVVGRLLVRTLNICCKIFVIPDGDSGVSYAPNVELKDQWCAWYGRDNWHRFENRLARQRTDPETILWMGMDIRMNVHDAGGISIPNDPDLMQWAGRVWKHHAETKIYINPNDREDTLVIPVDFKSGATFSNEDLHDFKLAA